MDATSFAHLRPKERTKKYAALVRAFVERLPGEPANEYWQLARACGSIDMGLGYRARWHTDKDQYRVHTKMRRAEARNIMYYLPLVDLYGNNELEEERARLLEMGQELIGIYDAIIKACS